MSSNSKIENIQDIVNKNLCHRCGTCVGLYPDKLEFVDVLDSYKVNVKSPLTAEENQNVMKYCSGHEVDFPELNKTLFGAEYSANNFIGHHEKLYIAFAKDQEIRYNSASGGILSLLLIYLLESKQVDGAVVLGMDPDQPWRVKPFIAKTRKEVMQSAQSKYVISSVNEILPEILDFDGTLAYVGLPCQVHSLRKMMLDNQFDLSKIKYIFGPYCGNTLHYSSLKSFLKKMNVHDVSEIKELNFRYGEWPGNMRVLTKSGDEFLMPKFHANYLIPFHIESRCLTCTDLSNEFTDISSGDAWAPKYEERGKGFSIMVVRSQKGKQLVDELVEKSLVDVVEIERNKAVEMHSHGYDLKKRGAFLRISFLKKLHRAVPQYGYEVKTSNSTRVVFELVLDSLFWICKLKISRYIIDLIPHKVVGKIFEKTRKVWKSITKEIKKKDLVEEPENSQEAANS